SLTRDPSDTTPYPQYRAVRGYIFATKLGGLTEAQSAPCRQRDEHSPSLRDTVDDGCEFRQGRWFDPPCTLGLTSSFDLTRITQDQFFFDGAAQDCA
ncbi:hypothetical protein, partial [Tessaracoccus sp.]